MVYLNWQEVNFAPSFTEEKNSSVRLDMPENCSHNWMEVMISSSKMAYLHISAMPCGNLEYPVSEKADM
jgi:hypothetical protein